LGGLFASPLVPGGKYWVALAIAYVLFRHIPHNDGLIEPEIFYYHKHIRIILTWIAKK